MGELAVKCVVMLRGFGEAGDGFALIVQNQLGAAKPVAGAGAPLRQATGGGGGKEMVSGGLRLVQKAQGDPAGRRSSR
jgi:hypothetical protein